MQTVLLCSVSRPTAICYWLLPIIAHHNNTTLLGTKIKAAVHVRATQMSIKTLLYTDTCDLKETVEECDEFEPTDEKAVCCVAVP
ncbi:hypothetical protein F2P81_022399 [Scophthalmus maximus]|uniref:Uncharacterized protein n=1 Tax=Scophthalmus maximus TaxID=52904 RepID=A0A6A4S052_SCOMX|nr:hypothetical protein F2P81_022399 [Scophthalmus maximus]